MDAAADPAALDDGRTRAAISELFRPPDGTVYVLVYDEGTGAWLPEDSLGHIPQTGSGNVGRGRLMPSPAGSVLTIVDAGNVVVRRRDPATSQWEVEAVLSGSDKPGNGQAQFGSAVAVALLESGEELVLVGAQNGGDDPTGGAREGSAYAFVRAPGTPPGPNAWTMEARLLVPDGVEGDGFGTSVALLPTPGLPGGHPGDALALVGAPGEDQIRGTVHVLVRDGATGAWAFEDALRPADSQVFDTFGLVSLAPLPGGAPGEALALAGAVGDDDAGAQVGAAYAFRRERDATAPSGFRWVEEAKLYPERPGPRLRFGSAVDLMLDTLTGGAPGGTPVAVGLVGSNPNGEEGSFPSEADLFVRTVNGSGEPVWTRRAAFTTGAKGPDAADWFGHAVALAPTPSGPLALVGAYYSNAAQEQGWPDAGLAAGAVFVYDAAVLTASEPGRPEVPAGAPEAGGLALAVRPNPVRSRAEVELVLTRPASVRLSAYDVLGRAVAVLHEGPLRAGVHQFGLDASALAPGLYLVAARIEAGRVVRTVTVIR